MPSRKKAKGKARRKAAKAAGATGKEDEIDRMVEACDAQLQRLRLEHEESCLHGCNKPDDDNCNFVKLYLTVLVQVPMEQCPWLVAQNVVANAYPQVMSNPDMSAIDSLFLALATNCVLSGDMDLARRCASSATYFNSMIKFISDYHCFGRETLGLQMDVEKLRELDVSDEHTLVRYLQKRIPCSCLDDKYEEVKDVKKIGLCHYIKCENHDGGVAERSSLMRCTRCRRVGYCSRECQVAHWPWHKELCEKMRRERKESKTNPPKYDHDQLLRKLRAADGDE